MGQPRIAVDAFGGDHCPEPEIEAALACARDGIEIRLVGDEAELGRRLEQPALTSSNRILVVR